jgi:hypothetical protein
MSDEKRGGPPSRGGPGGGNRDRRPGGEGGRRDGRKGGSRGKGGFGKGGPARPERRETYESLQLLTRGEGFHIDKFVLAEKGTHKPVKVEYRLTREGLKGVHSFPRLVEAQNAATAPLPEPEPEVVEEAVTETAEATEGESPETEATGAEATEGEAASVEHTGEEAPVERESVESVPAEDTPPESADSVEHVTTSEATS